MSRPKINQRRQTGHVFIPALAIAGLSILLAAGLEILGVLHRFNQSVGRMISRNDAENFPKHLPAWCIWLTAAVFAFGLAAAVLGTPGHPRRVVLWLSSTILVATWAPVLGLAAHAPEIGAPWIATVWSGVCAIVYAANHRMACDQPADSTK